MKWMDIPSVTEMDRGGVYEMDRQKKRQKNETPLKWIKFYKTIWTDNKMCFYILFISVAFQFFGTFSVFPFHKHLHFPFL